jgi:integrase
VGSIHTYETPSGKRYRISYRKPDHSQTNKRGFRTKRDAELYLATVEISKSRGDYIDPTAGKITVSKLGSEWIVGQGHMKPSTFKAVESAWRIWVEPRWGKYSIADIRHGEVQAWVAEVSKTKSATTTSRVFGVLASLLDSAVLDRRIHANPARGVKLPRKQRARKVYLSHLQVEMLAKQATGNQTLVHFLAYTGVRWGEATALRVKDIDLIRCRAQVVDNAVAVGGVIVTGSPKTHRVRTVPFPKFIARELERAIVGRGPNDLLFGDGQTNQGLPHSKQGWFAFAVRRVQVEDSSFPRLTPHELRHTAASLAVAAGANVKAIQRMLGHASAAMTLDIYADLFDEDLDAVADSLEEARTRALRGVA